MTGHTLPSRAAKSLLAAGLHHDGLTSRQIAAEMGLSYSYVRDLLTDPAGDRLRHRHERARRVCATCGGSASWPDKNRDEVICVTCREEDRRVRSAQAKQFYEQGESTHSIASKLHMSHEGVRLLLIDMGVPRRPRGPVPRKSAAA